MAKEKIVVKVAMCCDKKTRKAMKIAVSVCGVVSASLMGSDKDQITVTGEGIDSVELVKLLRKGVGCTEIVSVGPVVEIKPAATSTAAASQTQATVVVPLQVYPDRYCTYCLPPYHVYECHCNDDPSCTIM